MSYDLQFLPSALKEWQKLGAPLQTQFKKKLIERLEHPHVPADALHGMANHYKIKLRSSGYRLVYQVIDHEVVVFVVAVDRREREQAYRKAAERLK